MDEHQLLTWLTVREVARRLDYSQQYAFRLVQDGKLRGIRTKLGWLVDPVSVAAFEAARKPRTRRPRAPDDA